MEKRLSIIIVGYDEHINDFFELNKQHLYNSKLEFIIVNNGYKYYKIPEFVDKHINIKYIENPQNKGYGFGINSGMKVVDTDFCLICNNDIKFEKHFFNKLFDSMDYYEKKQFSVVGFNIISQKTSKRFIHKINYNPFIIMYHMSALPYILSLFSKQNGYIGVYETIHYFKSSKCVYGVSGSCFLIKKKDFDKLNGFDTRFFLMYDETDYFIRVIKRGWNIFYDSNMKVYHIHGSSAQKGNLEYFINSMKIFLIKHYGKIVLKFIIIWVNLWLFIKKVFKGKYKNGFY